MLLVSWRANSTTATCAWRLCAGLRPGQRDVLGWGWCCLQAPFCPAKGKPQRAAGVGGEQQGRGGQSIPSTSLLLDQLGQEPLPRCITAPCTLLPGLAGIYIPLTGFLRMVFQLFFFFVPDYLELRMGVLARKSFHGRNMIL